MVKRGDPKLEWLIDAMCRKVHETFPMHGMKKLCLRPEICPPNIIDIVQNPQAYHYLPIKLRRGIINQCHWNCADLFQHKYPRGDVQICVGFYAWKEEGLGRIHTWLVHKKGYIIETIRKAEIYVGTLLSLEECDKFVRDSTKTKP